MSPDPRIRRLNSFGSEAEFLPVEVIPNQKAEQLDGTELTTGGQGLLQLPPPDLVYDSFDQVARDILEKHVPGDLDRKFAWAVRMRSISEANRIHETNYRLIFGSQIAALKTLNLVVQAPAEDFRPFFENAASNPQWQSIHDGRTYEQWGQFLIDAVYVELVPDTEPELVRITPFGQQFLHWITQSRVSEFKPG